MTTQLEKLEAKADKCRSDISAIEERKETALRQVTEKGVSEENFLDLCGEQGQLEHTLYDLSWKICHAYIKEGGDPRAIQFPGG